MLAKLRFGLRTVTRGELPSRVACLTALTLSAVLSQAAHAAAQFTISNVLSPVDNSSSTNTYTSSSNVESTTILGVNTSGQVLEQVTVYSGGSSAGTQDWIYNPAATVKLTNIGLIDSSHENAAGVQQVNTTFPALLNTNGQAAGITGAYDASHNLLGPDAWYYNPTASTPNAYINPSTLVYDSTISSTTTYSFFTTKGAVTNKRQSVVQSLSDSGIAGGYSYTYYNNATNNSASQIGQVAWLYNPTGSKLVQVGVTANAQGVSSTVTGSTPIVNSSVIAINASGVAVGNSSRYLSSTSNTSLGQDAWYYDTGATTPTTVALGLTGQVASGSYNRSTTFGATTYPSSVNYSYTVGTSPNTGTFQSSQTKFINANGLIAGTSTRYNTTGSTNLGADVWLYDTKATSPAYTIIGLSGTGYDYSKPGAANIYLHTNSVTGISNPGVGKPTYIIGTTTRIYNIAGTDTSEGTDSWLYNSITGSTAVIAVDKATLGTTSGSVYESSAGTSTISFHTTSATLVNTLGMVAGNVTRYSGASGIGNDTFVFDPSKNGGTGQYYTIDLSQNANGYAQSTITYLSDTGVAVGYYSLYDSSSTNNGSSKGTYAFYWTETTGPVDLGTTVAPANLTAQDWASLYKGYYAASNGSIYGTGVRSINAANATVANTSSEVFVLSPTVPEPASLGILTLGTLAILTRKRRS